MSVNSHPLVPTLEETNWPLVFSQAELFLAKFRSQVDELPEWMVNDPIPQIVVQTYPNLIYSEQIRKPDCKAWIKENRFIGGIRKKRGPISAPRRNRLDKNQIMNRPATVAQYQRHSLHLISNVLNLRTNASPFTVILDDLNQRATPFVTELIRRGLSRNVNVVFLSFESPAVHLQRVRHVAGWGDRTGDDILREIESAMTGFKESLVIVDSLNDLLNDKHVDMGALFSLVSYKYVSTLVGIYHQDITAIQSPDNAYVPQSLDVIKYMATTVITCNSFAHMLAKKAAKERSLAEPTHGLLQGAEGIVESLGGNDHRGIVLEAEFRRKSGRPESETFFLRPARVSDYNEPIEDMIVGTLKKEFIVLLDQVPEYGNEAIMGSINAAANEIESTMNLGLTDKQKEAREGVILPYTDAQNNEGAAGEGGRILYDMGEEDDFDEEEDEI
ncbi:hypothetical protein K504DRAFT_465791 [Pleomassaria siparia CBS 279.74]|uniref:Elongator complex protein 5 n=1 Tax=Pleomassaria siparia CBS 279.74 TaxID=1314801 RepID=A0A6G1KD35_9PLEO|nr:hypothetical protein K504DRAFT_465791 [Pleomassaria siparia CBS 279.74]